MHLRRLLPRLTIRRLMIAVAIVAILISAVPLMSDRAERFRLKGARHRQEWMMLWGNGGLVTRAKKTAYHLGMAEKYERASEYPWLPVAPDPPEPK